MPLIDAVSADFVAVNVNVQSAETTVNVVVEVLASLLLSATFSYISYVPMSLKEFVL